MFFFSVKWVEDVELTDGQLWMVWKIDVYCSLGWNWKLLSWFGHTIYFEIDLRDAMVGISWASRQWTVYRLDMFLWIYGRYTTTPSVFRELPRSGRSMATSATLLGLCQTQIAHRLLIDCSKIPPNPQKVPKIPKNPPKNSPKFPKTPRNTWRLCWTFVARVAVQIEIDDAQEAATIGTKNHWFWCLKIGYPAW